VRVPAGSGAVDPEAGTGSYRLTDLSTKDYVFLANGIGGGPSAPSTVSFELRWSGVTKRTTMTDSTNRFALDGAETGCRISWTARREDNGFTFTSDPASSKPSYAAVYRERNGVFFKGAGAPSSHQAGVLLPAGLAAFLDRRGAGRARPSASSD
jgi:hypothetical protein